MLKIHKFVTMSPEQWEIVIEGARNAKNSWDRIDSYKTHIEDPETLETADFAFFVGPNDQELLESLAAGGSTHGKYRRMMPVWLTMTAPLYWWKEFDTYKVGTVSNSCSTMHKIQAEEINVSTFSFDADLMDEEIYYDIENEGSESEGEDYISHTHFEIVADNVAYICESLRKMYNHYNERAKAETNESKKQHFQRAAKKCWRMLIQALPSSYNQKRTIFLNYEVLAGIYRDRRHHKLTEWHTFCDWIRELPYSELITLEIDKGENEEN